MRLVNRNIKFLRSKLKLTQEKFAIAVGVKRSSIGSYEEDRAVPPTDILIKIAEVCKVSTDDLLNHKLYYDAIAVEDKPLVKVESIADPLFSDFPLFGQVVEKNEENHKTKNLLSLPKGLSSLAFISKSQIRKFVKETDLDFFFGLQPQVVLPFIETSSRTLAFDAPEDFLINQAVIIAEPLSSFSEIRNGENYILFFNNGDYSYRRVYNQIDLKGILLTNSDKQGVLSEEYRIETIRYIYKPLSFFSENMPKPDAEVDAIRNKISELNNLIGKL